jgi:hypothetical protein
MTTKRERLREMIRDGLRALGYCEAHIDMLTTGRRLINHPNSLRLTAAAAMMPRPEKAETPDAMR